jgi:hypothetical protein
VLEEGQGGDKQVEVVRQLYHRQLQTPQPTAQQLLQEYEEWERDHGHVSGRCGTNAAMQHCSLTLYGHVCECWGAEVPLEKNSQT